MEKNNPAEDPDDNKAYGSSKSDSANYNSKGTGMSSEAGSSQTEKSWQGIGGQPGVSKRDEGNKSYTGRSSENKENTNEQSDKKNE